MKAPLWIAFAIGCIGVTWGQSGPRRPPNYSQANMPVTSFSCRDKILGGYYADPETDCQMFHVCVKVPGQGVQDYKFLCPNNTSFDQENQICDDWFNIDCEASTLYYSDNFDLYRIGSDYDSGRVYPGAKLPSNNVNNAVSDPDDDYLRRADRGESVGNDLLRGSHSSNFFSNKNQGREDDEEIKKKPAGKTGVRKLLTGKRPISSTTSAATQPSQAPVEVTTRANFAGRNRGSSNFRGGFRSFNPNNNNNQVTQPQQQSQQQTLEPQRISYSAAPTTQRTFYTTAAPVTQKQNYYTTTTQRPTYYTSVQTVAPQRQNYYTTTTQRPTYYTSVQTVEPQRQNYYTTTTQRPTYYTTAQASVQQRQNGFTPSVAPTQRQTFFNSPATQQITGANPQPFAQNNNAQNFYNPTQQPYNTYQSTVNNYQTYQTTQTPPNSYNPQDYTSANNNYETAKLYKLNLAAQNNPNVYNNYNEKYEEPAGEFLKTAPSQNLGAANFNRIQNIYKTFNTSVAASYNTEPINATTARPTQNYNYANINRNTTPKPVYSQFTTVSTQQSQNYYQSTTQKPYIQSTYNGTTVRNYNAPTQTTYPTTQYNYYTTTTQKPYQTYQTSQQPSSPSQYTAGKSSSNYYQPQQNFNTATQTTQNYYNQPTGFAKPGPKGSQKKYTGFAQTAAPSIVTDKPRPFSTTSAPPQQPKAEKDQYDYAYYDDATHTEYDNLDTVEFVKTKSKQKS